MKIHLIFALSLLLVFASCDGGKVVRSGKTDAQEAFVMQLHKKSEKVWEDLFPAFYDYPYQALKVKFYLGNDTTICGDIFNGKGSFYCGQEETMYIGLSGSEAEINNAEIIYIYAHLSAHHIQYMSGLSDAVNRRISSADAAEAREQLIRMELMADYLAGVLAHHLKLAEDDIKISYSSVNHHSFEYSTAEKRFKWFLRGLQAGDLSLGDTFNIPFSAL